MNKLDIWEHSFYIAISLFLSYNIFILNDKLGENIMPDNKNDSKYEISSKKSAVFSKKSKADTKELNKIVVQNTKPIKVKKEGE